MMIQLQKKPASHLISAYNLMMTEMRQAFERAGSEEMTLQKALEIAKAEVVHLGEITADEAHEMGEYIKRDINDAAEYMMESCDEFYDWLMLDIDMIERKVMELFLSVADNTRLELDKFRHTSRGVTQIPVYKSGEISGPGTLICENCGNSHTIRSSSEIADCSHCGHHRFIRRK